MAITLDGASGITAPGVTDTGTLSTGTSSVTAGYQSEIKAATGIGAPLLLTSADATANPQVVFKGSRQFQVGTGDASSGFANTFYVYDATAASTRISMDSNGIVTGAAGNLMLVQNTSRITLSGTATVISTAIPSWVKRIVLNIVGMTTSGTSGYIVQIGSGSYTTSGYLGSGSVVATSGATTAFTTGFGMHNNNGATTVSHVTMTLNLQNAATNTWSESHTGAYTNLAVTMFGGGSVSLGGVLDRLQITTVNGTDTFTAGTINFQYE